MNNQDREAFEAWAERHLNRTAERITLSCGTDAYRDPYVDYAFMGFESALAHARKQTAELRAMLDELLLSVQGENIYLCDDVWAVADRITAQLKEQGDE